MTTKLMTANVPGRHHQAGAGTTRRRVLFLLLLPLLLLVGVGAAAANASQPQTVSAPGDDRPWPTTYTLPTRTVDDSSTPTSTGSSPASSTAAPSSTQGPVRPPAKPRPSSSAPTSTPTSEDEPSEDPADEESSGEDDGANVAGGNGKGSVWLNWMTSKDSYGTAPWGYDLRVSEGGITSPIKQLGYFLLNMFWDCYRIVVSLMVWAFQFILEFKFVDVVRVPANTIATVIEDTTNQLGIVPTLATLSCVVSGIWIVKGRSGAGFGEMAMTAVIVAILGMGLTKPVTFITGEDGLLIKAQEGGASITTNMLYPKGPAAAPTPTDPNDPSSPEHGGDSSPDEEITNPKGAAQSAITKRLLDTFIRTPHQLLNFGLFIDQKNKGAQNNTSATGVADTGDTGRAHKDCFNAYNEAFVAGDDGKRGSVEPMKKGSTCPGEVKDAMEHPDRSLPGAWMIAWAAAWTAIFGVILLIGSCFLIGLAAWEAAKFGLALLKSLLPGGNREGMFAAASTALIAIAFAGASIVMIGVYLITLTAIFNATRGWNPVLVYIFIDIAAVGFCVASCILFFRARKHGKSLGRTAAAALTPKGGPKPMPTGRSLGQTALRGASRVAQSRAMRPSPLPGTNGQDGRPGAPGPAGRNGRDGRDGSGNPPPRGKVWPPPPGPPRKTPNPPRRGFGKAAGAAAKTGVKAAAMYTVGTPVAAGKAVGKTTGKAALKKTSNTFAARAAGSSRFTGAYPTRTGMGPTPPPTAKPAQQQRDRSPQARMNDLRDRLGHDVPVRDRLRAADTRFLRGPRSQTPHQPLPGMNRSAAMDARSNQLRQRLTSNGSSHLKRSHNPAPTPIPIRTGGTK